MTLTEVSPTARPSTGRAHPPTESSRAVGSPRATMAWCLLEDYTTPRNLDELSVRFSTLHDAWLDHESEDAQQGLLVLDTVLNAAHRLNMKADQALYLAVALLDPTAANVLTRLTTGKIAFVLLSREFDLTSKEGFLAALNDARVATLLSKEDHPAMLTTMRKIVGQFFDACKDPSKVPAHKARLLTGFLVLLHAPRWVTFASCFEESRVIVSSFTELAAALAPKAAPTPAPAWGASPRRIL